MRHKLAALSLRLLLPHESAVPVLPAEENGNRLDTTILRHPRGLELHLALIASALHQVARAIRADRLESVPSTRHSHLRC